MTSYTYNRWKSSTVFGTFNNSDTPDSSILANATFDRNITVKNNINIGQETGTPILDGSGNVIGTTYTSTGGNIIFDYNGTTYTIGKAQLIKLLNNLATESYVTTAVNNAISALINNSPVSLDTLQELANALGNDPNFATTVSTNLGLKANINNPTFTGTITTPNLTTTTMSLNGNLTTNSIVLTPIEISRLTGISSNIQTQINNVYSGNNTYSGNNSFTGNNTFTKPIVMNNNSNYIISNTSTWTNLTGVQNCIMGVSAGTALTSGNQNVLIGPNAGQSLTTGTRNVFIGELAGNTTQTSSGLTFVGIWAGQFATSSASNCTYIGGSAGREGTTATNMVCVGNNAGRFNLTGTASTIIGAEAGRLNTNNLNNTMVGYQANYNATTGSFNSYLGLQCAYYQEGGANTAVGSNAFQGVSTTVGTGINNCAFGRASLFVNTSGNYNNAFGRDSLNSNSSGSNNVAIGWLSGKNNTIGGNNTFLGTNSGIDVSGNAWNASTAVGQNSLITASNQIMLGGLNSTIYPTVFIPSGNLTVGGTYRTGSYNVDITGNLNATTGLFVGGSNINTIYQPISGMSSYLTTASASTIYQPISGMSSYLTTATASTTYQPISGMSSYGLLSGSNAWTGTNTFDTNLPTSTLTPTLGSQFITKTYADSTYTTAGNIIGANNVWTGTNTFNTNLPTSTLTPTLGTQLITKTFGDATYQTISGMSSYLTTSTASSTYQTISGMSSYPTLVGANSFTNLNNINRMVITGRNNADTSATANIENTTGCHIQWNRPNAGGLTFFMNNRTNNTSNGGFRFQRYGGGVFIDEPFQILDTTIELNITTDANAGLIIPSGQLLTLTGNILANATTITPTVLSHISTLSSNAQTQIDSKSPSNNPTFTGTITAPIINASGLITANGGLTIPNSTVLTLTGNISANGLVIDPVELSRLNNVSSNIQTQLNSKAPLASPTFTGTITAPIINASGLITADGGLTIPSTKILTLTGDISANSTTISPVELSYLNNVSSNVQTQLDSKGGLATQNSWSNWNDFSSGSFNNTTNLTYSRTANIPTQQGLHLQWNRDGSDGYSYIMNNKGGSTTNSGFRFQRFNGSGVYIDEPLTIDDSITTTKTLFGVSASFSNTLESRYNVCKDTSTSTQSVLYQSNNTLYISNQTNNSQITFAGLDASANQFIPLELNSSGATINNSLTVNGNITSNQIKTNNIDFYNSPLTISYNNNRRALDSVPSYGSYALIGSVVVPAKSSMTINFTSPIAVTGDAPVGVSNQTVSRQITGFSCIITRNDVVFAQPTVSFNLSNWNSTRTFTYTALGATFKQYATNVLASFDPTYDELTQYTYKIYILATLSGNPTPFDVEYNTTTSGNSGTNTTFNQLSGLATFGYNSRSITFTPINRNTRTGTVEINDLVCNRINGNICNFGIYAYGITNTNTHVNCTFITNSATSYTVKCTGCKGIFTATASSGTVTSTWGINYTTLEYTFSITVSSGANFSYMII